MFEYYRAIDRGDVIDWPIELLHPSKIKVKVDDSFYQEITLFCTNMFNVRGEKKSSYYVANLPEM